MRLYASMLGLAAVMVWAATARAGVVLHEEEAMRHASGAGAQPGSSPVPGSSTVMIEGHREKIAIGSEVIVVDLDGNKALVIHSNRKTYYELPFPLVGSIGDLISRRACPRFIADKRTGNSKKLAGYQCDEYTGAGTVNDIDYSVEACYSTAAPGAGDYSAFVKAAIAKLDGAQAGVKPAVPHGIPLQTIITFKTRPASSAAKPPTAQQPEMFWRETKTTVTSVAVQSIDSKEFGPPAGFKAERVPRALIGITKTH